MTKASDNKYPKVILEERLSDGSDTSNPAADHRALFLGEDGALHLRDSSGTITAVAGSGIADQGAFTYLDATEGAAPGTPASGKARIYAKSDGRIYSKDDAGVEYGPFDEAGTPGAAVEMGWNWMRRPFLANIANAENSSCNLANLNDGTVANVASGGAWTSPASQVIDFKSPRAVGHVELVFPDAGHSSKDYTIDWSDDGSTWTAAGTYTGETALSRSHDFTEATHRFWRLRTTDIGEPGWGLNISELRMFPAGTDWARGITPTSDQTINNAANATDGDEGTNEAAASTGNQYLKVDLGADRSVSACVMLFSAAGNTSNGGTLAYSTDNSNWTSLPAVVWSTGNVKDPYWHMAFASPITARYWRFTSVSPDFGPNFKLFQCWG